LSVEAVREEKDHYHRYAERYAELPQSTREFLEGLDEKDLSTLKEAMDFVKTAKAVGKFNLWLLGGICGIIIASVAFGESVRTGLKWFQK